ncbi:MAG: phytoene desaturase [Proteobacteria bacterium]|nr:phytoene desaturase [Pseudomonadota bacterium]
MRYDNNKIAVIGAGLGGLSAACTLAARGYRVVVFEKNSWLGGKAAVLREQGYRFDMGPTILIYPRVLRKIFAESGRRLEDYLELVRLDPQWRSFFEDGSTLDLIENESAMAAHADQFAPGTGEAYRRFNLLSEELHAISNRFYFWRSLGSIGDTFEIGSALNLKLLRDVAKMRLGSTVAGTIRDYIKDPRVAQMLDHMVQYVGSAPDATPAILCAIAHMQTSEGLWYPIGGTGAVPAALTRLALELGVEFHTGALIRRIATEKNEVRGIELESGEVLPFSTVVSNSDAVRTHRELVGGEAAARFNRRRSYEPACSGVVLYLGLDKRYEHLAHHDFVFSRDPHEEFEAIYRKGVPAPDPTCYLCAPAQTEPQVAPRGGEALYVLVHTPYIRPGQNWNEMFPSYRRVILDKLKRTAGLHDIEDHIVFEKHLTPQDIHDRYRVLDGAIYGIASHGRLNGGFKPANHSKDVAGLYLAGGAAHPGPGMPMVMMSGWIAADKLDQDGRVRKSSVAPGAVA